MTENPRAEEAAARLILDRFYGADSYTSEDVAAAVEQVERDPDGSRILALDEQIPRERSDLRLARSLGTYASRRDQK